MTKTTWRAPYTSWGSRVATHGRAVVHPVSGKGLSVYVRTGDETHADGSPMYRLAAEGVRTLRRAAEIADETLARAPEAR